MRNILTGILALAFLTVLGQTEPVYMTGASVQPGDDRNGFDSVGIRSAMQPRKLKFNLEFGTTFGASRYGSYFGTYVAPHFTYPLNNRFSIGAGGYFSGISPVAQSEQNMVFGYPYGGIYSRSFIYVEGAYRMNDNLTLTGAVFKQVNLFNPSGMMYPGHNTDIRGFKMGVDYRIGDNIFIRGEVEVSNDPNPYTRSPFFNPAGNRMNDPFFYTP